MYNAPNKLIYRGKQMSRQGKYVVIKEYDKIKRNYEIGNIKKNCCKFCINRGQDCLDIEQKLENSVLTYRCKNYSRGLE